MSHFARMNESFRTYEWVISHVWMSHFASMNESWHSLGPNGDAYHDKLQWVTHTWMRHVTHINASCHPFQWIMSRIIGLVEWVMTLVRTASSFAVITANAINFNESHTREWVMSPIWMSHVTHMNESCHALQVALGLLITTNAINCYEFHPHEWVTSPI